MTTNERLREALTYVEEQHALHRQGKLGPTGYSSALSTAEAALRAALSGSSDPAYCDRADCIRQDRYHDGEHEFGSNGLGLSDAERMLHAETCPKRTIGWCNCGVQRRLNAERAALTEAKPETPAEAT